MACTSINNTKRKFSEYVETQIADVRNHPLHERRLSSYEDILSACKNVYTSGIIFPQGGLAAKRKDTPLIDEILANTAEKIYDYLNKKGNKLLTEEEFDKFHDKLCTDFLEKINAARTSVGYCELCYGSAQKFINMIFKYLSCYKDYCDYKDYFKHCHMPVDTVILKRLKNEYDIEEIKYREYVDKKGKRSLTASYQKTPWTKLDADKYKKILKIIREKVSNDKRYKEMSLLDVEFSIWE